MAYLWTLTLAEQSSDPRHVARLVEAFVRRLRGHTRCAIPYVWVLEQHKSGALHAHVGLDRYVPMPTMRRLWWHGFVFVTGARSKRSRGRHAGIDATARYLSKYVTKEVTGGTGRQTYRVAEGFQPVAIDGSAWGLDDALQRAILAFGGEVPVYVWDSRYAADDGDRAPPCWWATWATEGHGRTDVANRVLS